MLRASCRPRPRRGPHAQGLAVWLCPQEAQGLYDELGFGKVAALAADAASSAEAWSAARAAEESDSGGGGGGTGESVSVAEMEQALGVVRMAVLGRTYDVAVGPRQAPRARSVAGWG